MPRSGMSVVRGRLVDVTDTSTDHPTDGPIDHEGDRRLATIRGLLAKAEATDFPEEAEAFFAKASELISRWAIDEAMLWNGADRSGREQPDELQLVVHSPYLAQKAVLIGCVARANGCQAVRLVSDAIGVRWDFYKSMALKAQVDRIKPKDGAGALINVQPGFKGPVKVYAVALDFVF